MTRVLLKLNESKLPKLSIYCTSTVHKQQIIIIVIMKLQITISLFSTAAGTAAAGTAAAGTAASASVSCEPACFDDSPTIVLPFHVCVKFCYV
jgi:hypothetical protein